jgi:predicted nucleic acid-binding protein
MIRVVLDTNMLVSALLFEKGRLAWIRHGWQGGRFTPVLAQPTTLELLWVLGYPKFGHTPAEIELLLGELLPWSEI